MTIAKQTVPRYRCNLLIHTALFLCLVLADNVNIGYAVDYNIGEGENHQIASTTVNLGPSDFFGNLGLLTISQDGVLTVDAGTKNLYALPENILGLNLGKVEHQGRIESGQIIRFRHGSTVGGYVSSSTNVVFDGPVFVNGKIEADTILFGTVLSTNAGVSSTARNKIDLTAPNAALDANILQFNFSTDVTIADNVGSEFVIQNLTLGQPNVELIVSGDIVVEGNFIGLGGTILASSKNDSEHNTGNIWLKGNGSTESAFNNQIGSALISAANVKMSNTTRIAQTLEVTGNLSLTADSATQVDKALFVYGQLSVSGDMRICGSSAGGWIQAGINVIDQHNGIFGNGFSLESGATVQTSGNNEMLSFAMFGDSRIAGSSSTGGAAKLSADAIVLTGLETFTVSTQRSVINKGIIETSGLLFLQHINLCNDDDGTISFDTLLMRGDSVLDLSHNRDQLTGGLIAGTSSTAGTISVGPTAKILVQSGEPFLFQNVVISNLNSTTAGIVASDRLSFGENATLEGHGTVVAHRIEFLSGSTLQLVDYSHTFFDTAEIRFKAGSTISLQVSSTTGNGSLVSLGNIFTEDGVVLRVADGSNFEGRTRDFVVAAGGVDSVYSTNMNFDKSLFFDLAEVTQYDTGNDQQLLVVTVTKTADLINYAKSSNQRNVATVMDKMLENQDASAHLKTVIDSLMRIGSDAQYRRAVGKVAGDSRANSILVAATTPWQTAMDSAAFQNLSLSAAGQRQAKAASDANNETVLAQSGKLNRPSRLSPSETFLEDIWVKMVYHRLNLDADGNSAGGTGNSGGIQLGVGLPTPTDEAVWGLAFGYTGGRFEQRGDSTDIHDVQLGLYAGANLFRRNFQVRGYIGGGYQDYTQLRRLTVGADRFYASGSPDGSSITGSLSFIRPVDVSEHFLLKPTIGIESAHFSQDAYSETGNGIQLTFDKLNFDRTMLRMGASSDYSLKNALIWSKLFVNVRVAGDKTAVSHNQFFGGRNDEYGFAAQSVSLGDVVFDLGLGGSYYLDARKSKSLFLDYSAYLTEYSNAHSISAGFFWNW